MNSLESFEFEEKPILLVGDCTQRCITDNIERIDLKLRGVAYASFYQGEKTRTLRIPPKSQGNKHVLS